MWNISFLNCGLLLNNHHKMYLTCPISNMHSLQLALSIWTMISKIVIRRPNLCFVCVCVCVCVCVVQVNPTLWGQNVPTRMAISKILVRVGTFFGPHEETSL